MGKGGKGEGWRFRLMDVERCRCVGEKRGDG